MLCIFCTLAVHFVCVYGNYTTNQKSCDPQGIYVQQLSFAIFVALSLSRLGRSLVLKIITQAKNTQL